MPVGGKDSYFLRGEHPEREADSLEEAIRDIVADWDGWGSLTTKEIGNMVIQLHAGSVTIEFEVTDPAVLNAIRTSPAAMLDYLSTKAGMDPADAEVILNEAAATVRIDTIRDPSAPDLWRPGVNPVTGQGAEAPDEVLPEALPTLAGAILVEEDKRVKRGIGRRRTAFASKLLNVAVRAGVEQGLSDAEISRRTGVPRTTIRDTRYRQQQTAVAKEELALRVPGRALSQAQRTAVLDEIKRSQGNASEAARRLGLPPRTVREIRQREAERPREVSARKSYTATERKALVAEVRRTGEPASVVGRRLGVPGRTARGWIRSEKMKPPKP